MKFIQCVNRVMKVNTLQLVVALVIGVAIGMMLRKKNEGFTSGTAAQCGGCGRASPCDCPTPRPQCEACPPCREPDMSKYVLRASIPPCAVCPDLSQYILKSEVPPMPDLSQYVLKSSIPRSAPTILDCSKCNKAPGLCPIYRPARCPECPKVEAKPCPPCAPCIPAKCPPAVVQCKASQPENDSVRPFLAPMSMRGFGMD